MCKKEAFFQSILKIRPFNGMTLIEKDTKKLGSISNNTSRHQWPHHQKQNFITSLITEIAIILGSASRYHIIISSLWYIQQANLHNTTLLVTDFHAMIPYKRERQPVLSLHKFYDLQHSKTLNSTLILH